MEVLLTIIVLALVAFYVYMTRNRGHLENCGLPLVKPFLCFGSPPFLLHKIHYHKWYQEQFKKLGKTFARYDGVGPIIATIDPEMIKEITTKQFDNFTDVWDVDFVPDQTTMDLAKGDTWRALRKLMTPTFTTGKLKGMLEPIEEISEKSIDYVSKMVKENSEINMKPIVQGFALDTIARVAFGLNTNVHKGENQDFAVSAFAAFEGFMTETWDKMAMYHVMQHFPFVASMVGFWPDEALKLKQITHDVIKERDAQNIYVGDFIDRLREFKKIKEPPITDGMLDAQGMIFISAGFETTANTLGSLIYHLALHPEEQEKILDEINDTIGQDEAITHENIKELHYLEACVMETLRLCPPISEHDRTCTNDTVVNGVSIKKGTRIQLSIYSSHYNEEFFPEPEKYKPERFLKENEDQIIPYTWRPFGSGNRVCLGQRLAMTEMKIFMAMLLKKFKILRTGNTRMDYPPGMFIMITYPEIKVRLESR